MTDNLPEVKIPGEKDDFARPYWNPEIETMPWEKILEIQERKLPKQLEYLFNNSLFYRKKLGEAGFFPGDVRNIKGLEALPLTTKYEIRASQEAAPPFGLHLAAPIEKVVRVTTTAGTTGKPIYQAFTRNDALKRTESVCRAFWSFGIRPGDKVINGFSLSLFNAGIPFCAAIEHLGAVDIPVGAEAKTERMLRVAKDLGATVLVSTPSYAEYLAERCPEILGTKASDLGIKIVCGGGEAGFEVPATREKLEEAWGTKNIYDIASTSDAHPNMFANCSVRNGKHYMTPDLVLVELIEPESGRVVELNDGAEGEYVITHLDREACPLLRYRTGDKVRIQTVPCQCGRTSFRMFILGRTDEMLIIKGMNVYPSAIKSVVSEFIPETTGHLRIVLDEPGPQVKAPLNLLVEHGPDLSPDKKSELGKKLEEEIKAKLNFQAKVEMVPPETLERSAMKTKLVIIRGKETAEKKR